ncbi:MAG: fibronectin type III domain-containing protein [Chloroflexi bacterium]|nr:fibronectin type III domain-containing protein [Chloroflexota bacterium]
MSRKTRKLIWAVPLLAVFAVAGALAIFATQPADPAEAHGPPGPVTGISATASSYHTINLSWNEPDSGGDVTGYRIDYSADSYVWKELVADTGDTKTTYPDTGLKPETERYYRVFAMNSAGTGPVSTDESYAFTTTGGVEAPSAARSLVATRGAGQIDLEWTAPADNGGAKIARYCIVAAEIGTPLPDIATNCATADDSAFTDDDDPFIRDINSTVAGSRTLTVVTNSDKTEYEHKILDVTTDPDTTVGQGEQWAFQVYAVNMGATMMVSSTASNRATASVGAPTAAQKPATPMNLKGVQTGDTAVNLYWNEAKNVALSASATAVVYDLRTSVYDPAEREWSAWAVTNLSVTPNVGTAELTVTQGNADGTSKVRYQVRFQAIAGGAPASDWSNVATVPLYDSDHTLGNVEPDLVEDNLRDVTQRSSYNTIQLGWMRDLNAGFNANPTDDSDFTDDGELAPFRPTGYVIDYRDASVTDPDNNDAIYSSWRRLQSNTGYSRTYYYHRGLEQGSNIQYRIFPWHKDRFGTPQTITARTKSAVTPDPVRGLMVAADGPDKLTVTWPAVTNTGGSPITGYRIEVAISDTDDDWPGATEKADNDATAAPATGSGVVKSVDGTTTTYSYTDDDLIAGSTRWFRVFALNVQNDEDDETGSVTTTGPTDSDRSSAEAKKGTTAAGPNPMAPEDLTSELAKTSNLFTFGQTGVLLLWNRAKESRAFDPVSNYEIQRMVNGGEWEDLVTTTNTDTFHTEEDLPATGEMRAYRVRSETGDGKVSPWSNTTYFPGMHMADTAHVAAVTPNPLMDQNVAVGAMVTVDASAGFTGDMLTYSVMSSDDTVATATVDEMSGEVTITGVADGTATITVTATDSGMATATQTIAVTVPSAALGAPTNVEAMVDINDDNPDAPITNIVVTWTDGENADVHDVYLISSDFSVIRPERIEGVPSAMSHTFPNVAAGTYIGAVRSTSPTGEASAFVFDVVTVE